MSRRQVELTQTQRRLLAEAAPELAVPLDADKGGKRPVALTDEQAQLARDKLRDALKEARGPTKRTANAALKALAEPPAAGAPAAYQFKITLMNAPRPIWRRVRVVDIPLGEFHDVIQGAMGWFDCHLHHFVIGETFYGDARLNDGFEPAYVDEAAVKLSDLVPADGGRFAMIYEYDFGDSWEHKVELESVDPPDPGEGLPVCVKGVGRCPPEDVGGVWGYSDFIEAMADPKHEQHKEFAEWHPGPFDPDAFDAAVATAAMQHGQPRR